MQSSLSVGLMLGTSSRANTATWTWLRLVQVAV